MARFRYTGRTQRGEPIEGLLEGASADAVAAQLINSGVTPIEIASAPPAPERTGLWERLAEQKRATLSDLVLFARQMHALAKAGVPLIRAINGLAASTRSPHMQRVLRDVAASLESGRELASSLARHAETFPPIVISLVQVGEQSGRLDEAFRQIGQYLELEQQTRNRVKAALRYPAIVIVAIGVAIAVINLFVIPAFAQVFASFQAELPWATRLLMGFSQFTVDYWPHIAALLIGAVFGLRAWVRTERGRFRWDKWKLRLPLVGGLILRATLGRFARAFAMVFRSGVPLIQALTVVSRAVDNEYVADRILIMRNGIERGESLTRTASTTNLFTPLVLQMLSVGEETGAVDDMLDEVADFYDREVEYDLRTLSDAIEPIMIVAIGVMVLVLALGVFLPMWDLAGAAR